MSGILFITSTSANYKIANLFLLHIADWEYGLGNNFQLVTSTKIKDFTPPADGNEQDIKAKATSPTLLSLDSAWAGSSLSDVERFCLALPAEGLESDVGSLFVVLDEEGVSSRTCVLAHRAMVKDEDSGVFQSAAWFQKIRVPWDELYMTWCNLEVSNMDFEDFTEDRIDRGGDNDGWYEYCNHAGPGHTDLSPENERRRDDEIERLSKDGLV